jgi:regulatory protein
MPTITSISQQERDSGRYSISVDGEYAFALSANALLASGLHQGQELTDEELQKVRQAAHANRAYDQALGYLSYRKRSRRELRVYLEKKREYDDATMDATLVRLEQSGLVNDADLAQAWIADRQAMKPRSRRKLEQELRQKGLSATDIETALAEVSDETEVGHIRQIAIKKAARYPDRQKLAAYLGSLGFSYDLIKRALEAEN